MNFSEKPNYNIDDLLEIIRILRGENGCPWDRRQDHHSIRRNVIEEAYEVAEAIDSEDTELLKEELGDLLMQVVFHSQLESESGGFTFNDVCDGVCRKLIVRHPHIFGNEKVNDDPEAVLQNWEAIKRKTKGQATVTESLRSVPALPALMKTEKLQSRAKKVGFDPFTEDLLKEKISQECCDIRELSDSEQRKNSLSKVLFYIVALCGKWNVEPERLLADADLVFTECFSRLEESCNDSGTALSEISADELLSVWDKVVAES